MRVITKIHGPATPPTGHHTEIFIGKKTVLVFQKVAYFSSMPQPDYRHQIISGANQHFLLPLAEEKKL